MFLSYAKTVFRKIVAFSVFLCEEVSVMPKMIFPIDSDIVSKWPAIHPRQLVVKSAVGEKGVVCGIVHQTFEHGIVSATNPPEKERGEPDDVQCLIGNDQSGDAKPICADSKETS